MKFKLKCDKSNYELQKELLNGKTVEIVEEDSIYEISLDDKITSIKCKKQDRVYKIDTSKILYFQTTGRYNYLYTIDNN